MTLTALERRGRQAEAALAILDTLPARLRDHRAETGLSQRALAKRLGVSHALVSRVEGERQAPSAALARQILAWMADTCDPVLR